MILVQIQQLNTAQALLRSVLNLSTQLGKSYSILSFVDSDELLAGRHDELNTLLDEQNLPDTHVFTRNSKTSTISSVCEELEASFLFIQLLSGQAKFIRTFLNDCRDLRIPYLFF